MMNEIRRMIKKMSKDLNCVNLNFSYKKASGFISGHEIAGMADKVANAHKALHDGSGAGSDFLGWVGLPMNYENDEFTKDEYRKLLKASKAIRDNSEALLVIGIGGSYLGARAAIEALGHNFRNQLPAAKRNGPEVYFAGNNISSSYMADLLEIIDGKDISINVISKSGTTTEPAIAFRIIRQYMEKKYGKAEAAKRIYATTDKKRGGLKTLADQEGYVSFVIPDDVGGRFSILTPVGLLPIETAGFSTKDMVEGAKAALIEYNTNNLDNNQCYQYAAIRNILLDKGRFIEVMANYEPSLHYLTEWWKQLYGESEGKENKGIFPAGVDFSADLHSMGQYLQDGMRVLFETVLDAGAPKKSLIVPEDDLNADSLAFLAGRPLEFINKKAMEGTMLAHTDGGVPNLTITLPEMTPYNLGTLLYFFEKACGISGYMLGVNPFNQPGVEDYKRNMFALLGKPGYEEEKKKLESRL